MGSLGDRFEVEGGERGKYRHISNFRKYTFYYQDPLNFADGNIFFAKNLHFLAKIVPLLKAIA